MRFLVYTEEKKNTQRETVISNAIKKITTDRNESIILNNDIVSKAYKNVIICY
jgi:hypothetical protein